MRVRNLRTISNEEFLNEMNSAMLAAIERGNVPLAKHWAIMAASFALHSILKTQYIGSASN